MGSTSNGAMAPPTWLAIRCALVTSSHHRPAFYAGFSRVRQSDGKGECALFCESLDGRPAGARFLFGDRAMSTWDERMTPRSVAPPTLERVATLFRVQGTTRR